MGIIEDLKPTLKFIIKQRFDSEINQVVDWVNKGDGSIKVTYTKYEFDQKVTLELYISTMLVVERMYDQYMS